MSFLHVTKDLLQVFLLAILLLEMLPIVRHKSALSGVHTVCSHCLKCCTLYATEELQQASGVGDREGPPLVNPSAQEARRAGTSCHGPAMTLPPACAVV